MNKMTLGSLFDGSGGFPLGAILTGIEPLWASEVEPFPIRVTTKRLPSVKHLGDINKIDGAAVPPVDIITGGFCCQDLSVAGKRAGLHGERSGLFFQVVRIIKEMRAATNNEYPKFAVLENVPGMYSSNGGLDFQEVLNELIQIEDEALSVPLPEKGKWSTAGEIMGDGFSIGWRTLDAQFWGVAQRRRRCYIVVDLTGERAGEILFDESRLRGHPPQGGFPWQAATGGFETGSGSAMCLNDQGGSMMDLSEGVAGTLRAQEHGHAPIVFEPGEVYDARGNGDGKIAGTLTGDHEDRITDYTSVVLDNRRHAPKPLSASFIGGQGAEAGSIAYSETVTPTLRGQAGGNSVPMVMTAYGICSDKSNSMLSDNPHSGIYEAKTSRTLDANGGNPGCNQGGVAVVAVQGSIIGREDKNGPQGSGVKQDVSFTLDTADRHAVAYAMTTGEFTQACREKVPCLQARDYKDPPVVSRPPYIVRRLTPTECALLQGFPPDWCSGLETPNPTEEDIAFWSEIWENHRAIIGKSSKQKSAKQIIKWLKDPRSDAAEYKMWGNGVALPCVCFVLSGIVSCTQETAE